MFRNEPEDDSAGAGDEEYDSTFKELREERKKEE